MRRGRAAWLGVPALLGALAGAAGAAGAGPGEPAASASVADTSTAPAPAVPDSAGALPFSLVPDDLTLDPDGRGPRLVAPAGVGTDAFGRVVVTDAAAHRVVRYDRDGRWLDQEGALGSGPTQLRRPTGVATLGSLGMAVLDRENRRVVSYDLLGRRIGVMVALDDEALVGQVGRVDAVAIAADRGGALYVADAARDRVLAFDFAGRFLRAIGGYGTRSGAFRGLYGIATTARGELVTAERGGQRVQQLDAGGRVVRSWPLPVVPGRAALAVAVDDSARIAVADAESGRLWLLDPSGRAWEAVEGLDEPGALAFAPDGALWVAETGAGRLRRFTLGPRGARAPTGD